MKQLIAELPTLIAPEEMEELIVYLSAAKEAISAVLMTEREAKQMLIYFDSHALRGLEMNYSSMEKLVLALEHASKQVAGRLQKWSIQFGEYTIHYRPRVSVKGQILVDFIVERPEEDSLDTLMEVKEELLKPWILFMDGSSCANGSRARLILINLEGAEFTYALRFRFEATNNEAEYEALIAGLRIAEEMGVRTLANSFRMFSIKQVPRSANKKADAQRKIVSTSFVHLSKQVLVEALKEKLINKVEVLEVVEEEGNTWMNLIYEYLTEGTLLAEVNKARAVRLERANRSLGEGIKARLDVRNKNWMEEISHVLWAHPTMIKSSNDDTPFLLTYGTEAVIPAEIGMPMLRTTEVDMVQNDEALEINLDLLEERREHAAIRKAKSKAKMEKHYNSKVRNTSFKPGDLVYHSTDESHAEGV
ncbi:reverse transcriptase domain-containing protein [Tanacetum coccineum]